MMANLPPPPPPPPPIIPVVRHGDSSELSPTWSSSSGSSRFHCHKVKSRWKERLWDWLQPTWMLIELPILQRLAPRWLHPDFVWQPLLMGDVPIQTKLPELPRSHPRWLRLLLGRAHACLLGFSQYYCAWFGIPDRSDIASLPFGLVLKWADGTSLDEVRSMQAVRRAGIPAPKVISYGEHPATPHAPISILMTRLPGEELADVEEQLSPQEKEAIQEEIATLLRHIRGWQSPWANRICSISGGSIRSIRVPNHRIEICETETELNHFLLSAASGHSFPSTEEFKKTVVVAEQMNDLSHRTCFTHGDFALHNIMVHNGRVSGIIDWESAGWYPEYWEFTTPLRWTASRPEWRALLMKLGGDQYLKEFECEKAIMALTVDSWISW